MSIRFEGYERRIDKINKTLAEYGIASLEDAKAVCDAKGIDVEAIVKGVQPIAFENAVWAYTVGCAIAIKKECKNAADAAAAIGIGLQSFCIPGSVAEQRAVGLGHGNLAAMLLREETKCFAQGYPQRPRQRRGLHHQPHKRFHLRADQDGLLHR